jgi:hypothetical protein
MDFLHWGGGDPSDGIRGHGSGRRDAASQQEQNQDNEGETGHEKNYNLPPSFSHGVETPREQIYAFFLLP